MKQTIHKTEMIAFLALVLAVGAVQVSAAAVTMTIDACKSATGGEITVPLMINGVTNYGTGTINITYNPVVVHVVGVSDSSDSTVITHSIDNTAGIASISAWNTGGVSGDIVFANVLLKAVGSSGESSPLNLAVAKLVDASMNSIPAGHSGGVFAISGSSGDVSYTPTPTSGPTGQPSSQLTPPLPRMVGGPADPAGAEDSPESPPSQPSSPAEDADTAGTTDAGDDTEPRGVQTPSQKIPGPGAVSISLSILLVYLILTRNAKR